MQRPTHPPPPPPKKILLPEFVILMFMYTCMVKKMFNHRSITILILMYKCIDTKVLISEVVLLFCLYWSDT